MAKAKNQLVTALEKLEFIFFRKLLIEINQSTILYGLVKNLWIIQYL